jgi:hypothetical protein
MLTTHRVEGLPFEKEGEQFTPSHGKGRKNCGWQNGKYKAEKLKLEGDARITIFKATSSSCD